MPNVFCVALAALLIPLVVTAATGCSEPEPTPEPVPIEPGSDTHPEWSPDGSAIAYISNREGMRAGIPINFEVYRVAADGTGEARLTTNDSFDADIAWSPDGTTLLFKSFQDGNDEIYSIDMRTDASTNLTNSPASDGGPGWSPDGRTVVFHSDRGESDTRLYFMDADGSNVRPLANDPGPGHSPRWSPDGQRIVFVSGRDGNAEIQVANTDGTNVQRLTDDPRENGYPRWSPDGTRIAFTVGSFDSDRWVVFLMDADGGNARQIVDDTDSGNMTWSPDGTRLLFGRYSRYGENGGEDSRLFVHELNSGRPPSPLNANR
jgi:Tol biopolymer transport system component